MFRCVARYGYTDLPKEDDHAFEQLLIESLVKYLKCETEDLSLEDEPNEMDLDSLSVRSGGQNADAIDVLRTPLMHDQRPGEPSGQ